MKNSNPPFAKKSCQLASTIAFGSILLAAATSAQALNIKTGNPDVQMRWDNTLTYNIGWRAQGRDDKLGDKWISQATNHGWDRGDVVTNRVDLLSEFDFIYKEKNGFRVSAAAWNDFAYDKKVEGNPVYDELGFGTAYPNNRFTGKVERYYKRSGEILDAFVFTEIDVLDMPVNIRAGRHNLYWGESLFSFNSMAYAQGPIDMRKGTAMPGVEAKELFLPQTQISAVAQVNDKLSVSAFYMLEWDPHRLPEGGTYLGAADMGFLGGTSFLGFPYVGDVSHGHREKPGNSGSWGVSAAFPSELLNGTVGLYYREFDDRFPNQLTAPDYMYNAYAQDVKLYGISLSRLVGAVSVGAEISMRENTGLITNGGMDELARGDTIHALVNAVAVFSTNRFWDTASLSAELTYDRLQSISSADKKLVNHKDYGNCGGVSDGCVTDDAWGVQVAFEPTWYHVYPGIDMTLPINFGMGLKGNSATPLGIQEDSGAWSVGVGLDIHSKYEIDLAYNGYFGDYSKGPNNVTNDPRVNPVWQTMNGNALLGDRGWVSLTGKVSF